MFRLLLCSGLLFVSVVNAQDWAAFRGNDGSGVFRDSNSSQSELGVGLKVRWKRKLGSGYSSVVIAGPNVITMYCDDKFDYVVCLDSNSGEQKWRTKIGDAFKGENGSFDGPISTPVLHGQFVFALDPAGKLACLELESGKEIWSKNLESDLNSKRPLYGFATSPIVVDNHLIVQTGVTDGALAAFDLKTGEVVWNTTSDSIDSQSPVSMPCGDSRIVLAAGGKFLYGVNPQNGQTLFEYEHKGGNGSAMVPVALPDASVVLTLDDTFSTAVSLQALADGKINVSEKWKDRSIKNTYNVPVLCNENLFAYSTRILTCVDPATGKSRWKSRKPGDGFLIAVNDLLVVNTKKGSLHIANAQGKKYSELAQLKLFEDLVWSLPAYSDGAIYCRSLGEIACVELVRAEASSSVAIDADSPLGAQFQSMIDAAKAESNSQIRQQIVDAFLAQQKSFPVIEDNIVHFVFSGQAEDVAVAGDMFGARQEKSMTRISDTNLFYYAMELPSDQRANYMFLVDYVPGVDPRNERKTTSSMYAGEMEFAVRLRGEKPLEMSWFGMSDWKEQKYLVGLGDQINGQVVEHKVDESSKDSDAEVYLPTGYDDSQDRYRTIYVFSDPSHKTVGKLIPSVEKIFAQNSGVTPAILVFPKFSPFSSQKLPLDKLIESIDKKFRTKTERQFRSTVGFGFMASGALKPVFDFQDLIGNAAAYSPLIFDAEIRQMESAIAKVDKKIDIYVEWGRFDTFNPHENWDVRTIGKQIYDLCQGNKNIAVRGGMVNDSVDWSSWRNRYDEFVVPNK